MNILSLSHPIKKMCNKISISLLLSLIVLCGFLLRVYKLATKSLWYDEILSLRDTCFTIPLFDLHPLYPFHLFLSKNIYAPVSLIYSIFLKFWVFVFGYREFALRLPSVIFGVMSICIFFILVKNLYSDREALIGSTIFSFSVFHISWSQQARCYSLLCFLSLVSMYLFVKFLSNKFKKRHLLVFTLINLCLFLTHPYGIFVILAQICFMLLRGKDLKMSIKRAVVSYSVVILFFLLWLVYYDPTRDMLYYIQRPTILSLFETLKTYAYGGSHVEIGGLGLEISKKLLLLPTFLLVLYVGIIALFLVARKKEKPIPNNKILKL